MTKDTKQATAPKKPICPTKPCQVYPPREDCYQLQPTIKGRVHLACIRETYSLNASLEELLTNVDPKVREVLTMNDLHIDITSDDEIGYYDSHSTNLTLTLYTEKEVPNTQMEKEKIRYAKDVARYEKQNEAYKKAMTEYKAEMKTYKKKLKEWQIWEAKETLKRLGAE